MEHFSPSVMAQIGETIVEGKPYHHFKGNLSSLMALVREIQSDPSSKGMRQSRYPGEKWAGFILADGKAFIESGRSADAQKAFDEAIAETDLKGTPSSPVYAVSGGVWSVPRHLSGHPKAAIIRPRVALPPLHIKLSACFLAMVNSADVAFPLAKVAKAAWSHIKKGGVATVTCNYSYRYARPNGKFHGLLITLNVPLADVSAIASSLSVQTFRCPGIGLAQGLSGQPHDGLWPVYLSGPGIIRLEGNRKLDTRALAAAGIK